MNPLQMSPDLDSEKRDRPIASNPDFDEMKIVFRLDDPESIFVDHLKKFLRSCNF